MGAHVVNHRAALASELNEAVMLEGEECLSGLKRLP